MSKYADKYVDEHGLLRREYTPTSKGIVVRHGKIEYDTINPYDILKRLKDSRKEKHKTVK